MSACAISTTVHTHGFIKQAKEAASTYIITKCLMATPHPKLRRDRLTSGFADTHDRLDSVCG